jgi:hypothetical protein
VGTLQPWQLFNVILAGWMNRHQQEVIEYFRTENHVLKEKLGKKRILLDDDQRRHRAVEGRILFPSPAAACRHKSEGSRLRRFGICPDRHRACASVNAPRCTQGPGKTDWS